jgi:hypothetical protein
MSLTTSYIYGRICGSGEILGTIWGPRRLGLDSKRPRYTRAYKLVRDRVRLDLMGNNRIFVANPTAGFRAANQKHLQGALVTCRLSSDVRKLGTCRFWGYSPTFRIFPRFFVAEG